MLGMKGDDLADDLGRDGREGLFHHLDQPERVTDRDRVSDLLEGGLIR